MLTLVDSLLTVLKPHLLLSFGASIPVDKPFLVRWITVGVHCGNTGSLALAIPCQQTGCAVPHLILFWTMDRAIQILLVLVDTR